MTCDNKLCENGSTCKSVISKDFYCLCPPNFYGKHCEYSFTISDCNGNDKNETNCLIWSKLGYCSYTYSYNSIPIPFYCPNSCGLCKNITKSSSNIFLKKKYSIILIVYFGFIFTFLYFNS